jgi:serine/threonine protein kinase
MEPQKFGRYEIKAEIGRGGMATVFHAYDPRFERDVAIKVLPREMLHDPQFRTRFEREAKTVAMLEHPVIVPVYDFGEEDGQPYFVMRYMAGGSLTDRMKQGPMSLPEAARLFRRLAPALDEAHAKGIIHRDLKPGNILFDKYGEPYVSDFGIAKITEATQGTITGNAIVGTPAYMSPEQAQGESIDGRSDIYSLGVILFELLTGQQPYHGDTPMSLVVKQITEPVPHILQVKPDLPPAIEGVIENAMAKSPAERFLTVNALAEALDRVADGKMPEPQTMDTTVVTMPRSVMAGSPTPPGGTLPPITGQGTAPAAGRKKTGLWIGLGAAALFMCAILVAGIFLLKDKLPFLAAPATLATMNVSSTGSSEARPPAMTDTREALPPPVASATSQPLLIPTFTPAPSLTPTVQGLATIGGADLVAFLNNNDIWVMGVDGSNPTRITKEGTSKSDLQWSPDGQSLFYISGKCIQSVSLQVGEVTQITCFPAAEYLEAFEISPDGTQVAISLNRVLYVVPFDLGALKQAHTWPQLEAMKGCFTYGKLGNQAPPMQARWSSDGKEIAVNTKGVDAGIKVDQISVFNISTCDSTGPYAMDTFPATRFTMTGYNTHPTIPSFDWDGNTLFVLNSIFRYNLGYLYEYNLESKRGEALDPLGTSCCYTAARFSPDGNYLLFAYQNINSGGDAKTQLYYISYGSLGTGASYTPLALPDGFFSSPGSSLDATLRPASP